jgi:SagB-type dehydrogenase family enzyme
MSRQQWEGLRLPGSLEEQPWEVFHENSKLGFFGGLPPDEEVEATMRSMHPALVFEGYPAFALPTELPPIELPLDTALRTRVSARTMRRCTVSFEQLAAFLFYAYGITRDNADTHFARAFRVVPSGGALYPLEIFFYSSAVSGLQQGVYHYNPDANCVRLVLEGDRSDELRQAVAQPEVATEAAVLFFITALFERATFKYGDRGYRFALIEAGHVGQNMNLVANGLGLGSLNVGGFFDNVVDDFLGLDGVTHSTLYIVAVADGTEAGGTGEPGEEPESDAVVD